MIPRLALGIVATKALEKVLGARKFICSYKDQNGENCGILYDTL